MDYKEKVIALLNSQELSNEQKEMLEEIFSELKESEDERIRKALLNEFIHLQSKDYKFAGLEGEEIAAWLEKQGKKLDDKVELSAFKDKLLELFQRFRWYCKDETPTNGDVIEYVDANIQELLDTIQKPTNKVEPIVVRDFNSVFSREQVEEIDKRIEESQRLYNAKLRDAMRKVKDFPMTD